MRKHKQLLNSPGQSTHRNTPCCILNMNFDTHLKREPWYVCVCVCVCVCVHGGECAHFEAASFNKMYLPSLKIIIIFLLSNSYHSLEVFKICLYMNKCMPLQVAE